MSAWISLLMMFFLIPSVFAQSPPSQASQAEKFYQAGVDAFERGDCEAAFNYFRKITDIDYLNDPAFFAMARLSYLMRKEESIDRAIEYAETASRINPEEYSYQKFLASVYVQRSVKDENEVEAKKAENFLKKMIETFPERSDGYLLLANLYAWKKDPNEEMLLNKALSLDGANPDIYSSLGIFHLKRNPWDGASKAKEYFKKAMSLDPSAGHYGMSYLHFLQDQKEAALKEFGLIPDANQRETLAEAFKERYGNIKLPEYKRTEASPSDEYCKDPSVVAKLKKHKGKIVIAFLVLVIIAGIYHLKLF